MRIHPVRRIAIVLSLLLTVTAFAQMRGKGRLQGTVTDKATGKPIAGASVTVSGGDAKPQVSKTNARGQWSAAGLTSGTWSIEIDAEGYRTLQRSAAVTEGETTPPIRSEVEAGEATVPMEAEIANVPDSLIRAVNEAQELLRIAEGDDVTQADGTTAQASATEVRENGRKAAALLEGALPNIPGDTNERKAIRSQVQQVLAQALYQAGDLAKAIETLQPLVAADPTHAHALLLVNFYLEADRPAEGKALLEGLPADAVADPNLYINVGISFLNKDSNADAVQAFDKAITLDAASAPAYYYRGLAHLRLKKHAEAKADLEKVLTLSPQGAEANDARQRLAGLP